MDDRIERPHAGWWVAVLGGLGSLAVVALDPGAYAAWSRSVTPALSQPLLQLALAIALLLHVGEALYARRLAQRAGFERSASGWFWQTLAVGFPSLRLIRRRAGAAR